MEEKHQELSAITVKDTAFPATCAIVLRRVFMKWLVFHFLLKLEHSFFITQVIDFVCLLINSELIVKSYGDMRVEFIGIKRFPLYFGACSLHRWWFLAKQSTLQSW